MTTARRSDRVGLGLAGLVALAGALFVAAIALGSVRVPLDEVITVLTGGEPERRAWATIVLDIRLPRAVTAALAGAALGAAGLLMQTLFRNPLADPFTLGITAGASFGVALVVLSTGSAIGFAARAGVGGAFGVTVAAAMGAALVVVAVLAMSGRVGSSVTLLVVGLMIGYVATAAVSLLVWFADDNRVSAYINWGFGSFRGTTWGELAVFAPVVAVGLVATAALSGTLNAMLLGERYAESMGVAIRRTRVVVIVASSLLAGVVTAFCGPIAFVGIAVPHLARSVFGTSDHRVILPASVLIGAAAALAAELVAQVPGQDVTLPINAVTALVGAPVVVAIVIRTRRQGGFV